MLDYYYIDKRKIKKDLTKQLNNELKKHLEKWRYNSPDYRKFLKNTKKRIIKGKYKLTPKLSLYIECHVGKYIFYVGDFKK